jgi:DNA-binding MurR/RpiR family transcriptional regulator
MPASGRPPAATDGVQDLQSAIAANYDRLTAGQRKVIDRMLADTRYAAITSAPGLAAEVGVSESTITRAAQALGFSGYPDLQARLRDQFIGPVNERVSNISGMADTPETAAIRIMLEDAEFIRMTAEDLAPETLTAATDILMSARNVYTFGARGSYGLAHILGIGLRLLLPGTRILNQTGGDLEDQLIDLGPEDALLAVSFRRMDRVMVNVVRYAAEVGAKTIVISDHLSNPVSRHATITLIARTNPVMLMPAFATATSLGTALIAAVSHRILNDNASDRLERAEYLWEHFETYTDD